MWLASCMAWAATAVETTTLIRIARASLGPKVWTVRRDVDEGVVGCGDAFDGHVVLGEEYLFNLTNRSIGRSCGGRSSLI